MTTVQTSTKEPKFEVRWNPETIGTARRWLITGEGGTGKSYWATSSFWDSLAQSPIMVGKGKDARPVKAKLITIGQESVEHLGIPDSYMTGGGMDFRLKASSLEDGWLQDFAKITQAFVVAARTALAKGEPPPLDVVIIDGISEAVLLQNKTFQHHGNKFATWDHLESMWFGLFQGLDPRELGCHVILTARPMERDTGIITTDDEGHKESEKMLAPSMRGNFLKRQLSCYFDYAFYIRPDVRKVSTGPRAGLTSPVHVMHTLANGRYDIKNSQEERWLHAGYPDELVNASFWDVQDMVGKLSG